VLRLGVLRLKLFCLRLGFFSLPRRFGEILGVEIGLFPGSQNIHGSIARAVFSLAEFLIAGGLCGPSHRFIAQDAALFRGPGRGEISSKALRGSQAGFGWQPLGAQIAHEPGLFFLQQLASDSRALLPGARELFGSWRSRRYAPSRNSFPREAKSVRDRRQASP